MGHSTDSLAQDVLCQIGTGGRGCKVRMYILTICIPHFTGSSRQYNRVKKKKKKVHDVQIRSEGVKLYLFIVDMISYIENTKQLKKMARTNKQIYQVCRIQDLHI